MCEEHIWKDVCAPLPTAEAGHLIWAENTGMGKRTSGEPNPQIRGIKWLDSSNKLCSVHIVDKWIIVRVLLLCVWCSFAGYWLCTCSHTVVAKNVIRSKLAKQKQDQNQLIRSYQGQVGSFPFERSSVGLGKLSKPDLNLHLFSDLGVYYKKSSESGNTSPNFLSC